MVALFPEGQQARPRSGVDGTDLHTEGELGVSLRPRSRASPVRAGAIRLLLQGRYAAALSPEQMPASSEQDNTAGRTGGGGNGALARRDQESKNRHSAAAARDAAMEFLPNWNRFVDGSYVYEDDEYGVADPRRASPVDAWFGGAFVDADDEEYGVGDPRRALPIAARAGAYLVDDDPRRASPLGARASAYRADDEKYGVSDPRRTSPLGARDGGGTYLLPRPMSVPPRHGDHGDFAILRGLLSCPWHRDAVIVCIGRRRRRRRRGSGADGPRRRRQATLRLRMSQACRRLRTPSAGRQCWGFPWKQTVPNTCALVACTVCLEAQHRREFEAVNGSGTFPCHAAAPQKLRQACFREKRLVEEEKAMERTWEPKDGVRDLGRVLDIIVELGALTTTNAPPPAPHFLRLGSWERHSWRDGLTADFAARLIHERGPCVGVLFLTSAYHDMDASKDGGKAVFRGCHRSMRKWRSVVEGEDAGHHAVVCFEYRHDRGELQILILDNHGPTGPPRWISFEELDEIFTLCVQPMPSEGRLLG